MLYRSENLNGKLGNSTINYSNYVQDFDGIYKNWSLLTWKCQSPVYPKFIEKDTTGYIEIRTEADLEKINNNYTNYMLVADIFLSKPFKQITTFTGNFISATRTDGAGINGSPYYAIYNINYETTVAKNTAVGIFQSAERASIRNINFVYGTTIKNPLLDYSIEPWYWDKTVDGVDYTTYHKGIKVILNTQNTVSVGSIIGYANNCTISNCNVYFANGATIDVSGSCSGLNVGGVVGSADNCQVSGSFNHGSVAVNKVAGLDTYKSTFAETQPETPIVNVHDVEFVEKTAGQDPIQLNVGGVVGVANSTLTNGLNVN